MLATTRPYYMRTSVQLSVWVTQEQAPKEKGLTMSVAIAIRPTPGEACGSMSRRR